MGEQENMVSHQHHERFKAGIRAAVTWLHQRAEQMNDPSARQVLNSAATNLGWDLAAHRVSDITPSPHSSVRQNSDHNRQEPE